MLQAYKILARQEKISNNEAKALIDLGLVSANGKKVLIARALMSENSVFKLIKPQKAKVIFEDENIIAINKPAFITSQKIEQEFAKKNENISLLNRLDKETSGILLLTKNADFKAKAVAEYKALRVQKTYFAVLCGILGEELELNAPIHTTKSKSGAFSKVDFKQGKSALTKVYPLMCEGKKTLAKICIQTGRTHQIRVHLAYAGYGVYGDLKYAKSSAKRIFLHSYETKILSYSFKAPLPAEFNAMFDLPKELVN